MEMFLDGEMIDLRGMTRRELLVLMTRLETDADSIKTQLDRARGEQKTTGRYADQHWYTRAKAALTTKRRQVEVIKRELSVRRDERITSISELFVEAAKLFLADDTFDLIMQEAKANLDLDQLGGA